jgi:glycosyltransferase involved in cell wall biosynthesis
MVAQDAEIAVAVKGCRVVTTSMTARLLLANQLRSLDDMSWCVVSGDTYDDAPAGLDVVVVPLKREFSLSDLVAFGTLWRTFRRRHFDLVQTHTPKASFLGLPAARLSGRTALYTVHGALYFRDNSRRGNVAGWLFERWCSAWADRVLLQSAEDMDVLARARIAPRAKLRYVGNGIVVDRFLEPVVPAPLGDGTRPVVLMVSRLVAEKGCRDFLAAARTLGGRATFVHVGPAEPDQSDALGADELGAAAADVDFVGAVDDIRPYLAAADVVVQPSYREGIPRVVMEAGAAGRPVVAYDTRGVREVVDADTGVLVTRGDVGALTDAVEALLGDATRRQRLGDAARRKVVERFSEDAVLQRLRAVYAELAATP